MSDYTIIEAWSRQQLFPWRSASLNYETAIAEYARYNETTPSTFLFRFSSEGVGLVPKPRELYEANPITLDRAEQYLQFFCNLHPRLNVPNELILALEVGDGALESKTAPVFSFQKLVGQSSILLNDVNLIEGKFYTGQAFADDIPYVAKRAKAVFTGSTSGMHNSLRSVQARENPRIDAGLFFKNNPEVDFRLPHIVQCEADAEQMIRSLGFGGEAYMSWQEQFAYKFLISMDGNGATCQRLAVALNSNSALLKYDSVSQLYYFSGLIPWHHYVPISSHQDVLHAIELERSDPESFARIARNGQEFFANFLTEDAVMRYAGALISGYQQLFKR